MLLGFGIRGVGGEDLRGLGTPSSLSNRDCTLDERGGNTFRP